MIPRIGQGYDVHRLTEGRALVLGGVTGPGRDARCPPAPPPPAGRP